MLHADEKIGSQEDFKSLIESSGQTGKLYRPIVTEVDSFDGPFETHKNTIAESFPLEWHPGSPDDLKLKGHSGTIHVLPDLPVYENDIVEFDHDRYRVTDIQKKTLFGTVTHMVLQLEKEYRG